MRTAWRATFTSLIKPLARDLSSLTARGGIRTLLCWLPWLRLIAPRVRGCFAATWHFDNAEASDLLRLRQRRLTGPVWSPHSRQFVNTRRARLLWAGILMEDVRLPWWRRNSRPWRIPSYCFRIRCILRTNRRSCERRTFQRSGHRRFSSTGLKIHLAQ